MNCFMSNKAKQKNNGVNGSGICAGIPGSEVELSGIVCSVVVPVVIIGESLCG